MEDSLWPADFPRPKEKLSQSQRKNFLITADKVDELLKIAECKKAWDESVGAEKGTKSRFGRKRKIKSLCNLDCCKNEK